MIEIPSYPLTKPKESDAYEDWEKLLNTTFVNLFEHRPWKSRSVINDDYCYDYSDDYRDDYCYDYCDDYCIIH